MDNKQQRHAYRLTNGLQPISIRVWVRAGNGMNISFKHNLALHQGQPVPPAIREILIWIPDPLGQPGPRSVATTM